MEEDNIRRIARDREEEIIAERIAQVSADVWFEQARTQPPSERGPLAKEYMTMTDRLAQLRRTRSPSKLDWVDKGPKKGVTTPVWSWTY